MINSHKPDIIKTFNNIADDIEIISHTHVRIKGVIKTLSDLNIEERRRIWSIIYPHVYDVVGDELVYIESGDYIFAISSCITPLIINMKKDYNQLLNKYVVLGEYVLMQKYIYYKIISKF